MSDTENAVLITKDQPMTQPASTISLATQRGRKRRRVLPVSYTHLTLPTIYSV